MNVLREMQELNSRREEFLKMPPLPHRRALSGSPQNQHANPEILGCTYFKLFLGDVQKKVKMVYLLLAIPTLELPTFSDGVVSFSFLRKRGDGFLLQSNCIP